MKSRRAKAPACPEARTTIAVMAAILLSRMKGNEHSAVEQAQSLYDRVVAVVERRHQTRGGKGRGSYPAGLLVGRLTDPLR